MKKHLRYGLLLLFALAPVVRGADQAQAILSASGVKGGLIVHVGCGDGKLTAALRVNDSFIVHGLDADVTAARKHIQSLGLYGPVSVAQWDGKRLPYIENFVNLLVVSDGSRVPDAEIMRVLAPNGIALVGGKKITKPRPKEIDEWTHYLHDPSNNAVAHDSVIDFLARMQWIAGPRYSRHHDHMSGASAMVSANGRNFYVFEEAPRASILIPPEWYLYARDAFNGTLLWEAEHLPSGHSGSPKDILVLNGVVWSGATSDSAGSGITKGYDLHTGKVVKEFPPDVKTHWFHQRCYRQKATDKYLLYSRTGIEFVDVANAHWTCHHWTRGGCLYGIMPANGMIYNPPHPCACYLDAKLYGFHALAPASKLWQPLRDVPDAGRLEQSGISDFKLETSDADWPTYRGNAARSGFVKTTVPATDLKRAWQTELGGKISAPVIAGGKVFVAAVDRQEVIALDANTGKKLWSFTAGGRVDSAPTIWQGRVLFGCADGYVYCLRATDGALAWRFRAAPEDRRHFAFEQIESVWPVSGSVLVQNDSLYCIAGRSMFLDGGLRMLRLDPKTGKKLSEIVMDENDPYTKTNLQSHIKGLNMPVALPDVLSSDGRNVYMRTLAFDMEGKRKMIGYTDVKDQQGDDRHLFSPTGFLDDTLWHRTSWEYGRAFASGAGGYYQAGRITPAGRILVFDDQNVYGYGRRWQYYRWTTPLEFHLFATAKQPEQIRMGTEPPKRPKKKDGKPKGNMGQAPLMRFGYAWSDELAVQATAMTLADKTLFVAGPPDLVDEEQATKSLGDPETKKKLAEQEAAFEGKRGALLAAVSAANGQKLAAYRLDFVPIFDGLAAANGRLYLTTMDGKVICLGAGGGQPLPAAADAVVTPRGPDADKPTGVVPAATTSKAKTGAKPQTHTHPDFQTVSAVTVTSGGLGYKLVADEGENGFALKQLAAPLTKPVTFKLKIQPTAEGKLQTGFLAFGDGAAVDQLVKCGLRVRTKKCYIMQGPAKTGTTSEDFTCESGKPVAVEVTVDFAAKKVKMALPGKTIEAPLASPLKQITHVGYCVMQAVTEFSAVEISGGK